MSLPPPILAANNFEGLIAVAFLVISVIGWVINQAGGQKNQGPKPGAAPRPQPKRQQVQSEIDSFLQQATGKRPARGNADQVAEQDIELVEEAPRRVPVAPERRPPSRPQAQPRPVAQTGRPAPQPRRTQPQPVRTPNPTPMPRATATALGQGVRQHVAVHMADQISQRVAQEVPHAIDAMVQQHLGTSMSSRSPVQEQSSAAAFIGIDLTNANAIRQAVILNEILSPPLSRRSSPAARRNELA
jgi:hypothetical protein